MLRIFTKTRYNLVRDIKNNSSNFINEKKFIRGKFSWQEGYGAFSYSHSQIENVYNYILNQEQHHHKKSFKEEYLEFLEKFQIEFKEKFLFECIHPTKGILADKIFINQVW